MTRAGSTSVRAGNWMYIFFNQENTEQIDYWRISMSNRKSQKYKVSVQGEGDNISGGGAISAIYLSHLDEIHLYYLRSKSGDKMYLKETALRRASQDGTPEDWDMNSQALNKQSYVTLKESIVSATTDSDGTPFVFYNADQIDKVNCTEYLSKNQNWSTYTIG